MTRVDSDATHVPVVADPPGQSRAHRLGPRPVLHILRWVGHGDLRVVTGERTTFVSSDDLHTLVGHDGEARENGIPTTDWMTATAGHVSRVPLYTVEDALRALDLAPTDLTADAGTWLSEQMTALAEAVEQSTAAHHSVGRAATMLSRDPNITITETQLFAALAEFGWIKRGPRRYWVPQAAYVGDGLLTVMPTIVRTLGPRHVYEQVRITPAGVDELHRLLGGASRWFLSPTPTQPTLFEE